MAKPGGVDLDETRRAERLQVTVHAANRDEHSQQRKNQVQMQPTERHEPMALFEEAPLRGGAEEHIHGDRSGRANEHSAFSAEAVGEQAIDDLAAGVGQGPTRQDRADVRPRESELVTYGLISKREVVTAHVEGGVQQTEKPPVQPAPRAKAGRIGESGGSRCRSRVHEAFVGGTEQSGFARQLNKPTWAGQKDFTGCLAIQTDDDALSQRGQIALFHVRLSSLHDGGRSADFQLCTPPSLSDYARAIAVPRQDARGRGLDEFGLAQIDRLQ